MRTRTLFLLLVAAAALVAWSAATAAAAPSTGAPLKWRDCGDGFRCATVRVPRDYDAPQAGTITLSVIQKPHTGTGKAAGTVFTNPGGPGGSGVDFLRGAADIFAGVNKHYDLVSLGPARHRRAAEPVDCLTPAQRDARWPLTPAYPTIADLPVLTSLSNELIAGCVAADTQEPAADLHDGEHGPRPRPAARARWATRSSPTSASRTAPTSARPTRRCSRARSRARCWTGPSTPRSTPTSRSRTCSPSRWASTNSLNRFFDWCGTSPICGFEGGRPAFDELLASTATAPLPATASGDPRPVLQADVQNGAVLPLFNRASLAAPRRRPDARAGRRRQPAAGDLRRGPRPQRRRHLRHGHRRVRRAELRRPQLPAHGRRLRGRRAARGRGGAVLRAEQPLERAGAGLRLRALAGPPDRPVRRALHLRQPEGRAGAGGRQHRRPRDADRGRAVAGAPARARGAADHGRRRPHGLRRQQQLHRRRRQPLPEEATPAARRARCASRT